MTSTDRCDAAPRVIVIGWPDRCSPSRSHLAHKQYYPDTEVYGHYDTYWQPASTQGDLRGEVGVRVNLPIYCGRLSAGVREAEDRLNRNGQSTNRCSSTFNTKCSKRMPSYMKANGTAIVF